ncbi:outer kinetochore KNL1 complex subunit ZWINT isoform X2 [Patagioenas fasciata]|uniref:outer kinetochore KNL1 complex subunit ZWINT isoform X2 n=1 Tax=Patagioenas fasciata TaxID=372321 RepID=UPI003A995927
MAGPLERARGLLGALEAALSPPGEDGDVPPQVLVEHLLDRRRKRKLLLTQLRVLQRLLQVLQCPDTPPALPDLRAAQAQARNSWRELKLGYGGALETLGGALPPTLARMGEGRRLQRRLQEAVTKHLQAQLHEALERRQQASGCRCSSGWRSCGGSGTASRGRCRGCGGRSSGAGPVVAFTRRCRGLGRWSCENNAPCWWNSTGSQMLKGPREPPADWSRVQQGGGRARTPGSPKMGDWPNFFNKSHKKMKMTFGGGGGGEKWVGTQVSGPFNSPHPPKGPRRPGAI